MKQPPSYRHDLIFSQWLPVLNALSIEGQLLRPIEVWDASDAALRQLGDAEPDDRPTEIMLYYESLCRRSPDDHVFPIVVMAVVLTRLANASANADDPEDNPHADTCATIADIIGDDELTKALLVAFFHKRRDRRGNKIVIPANDCLEQLTTATQEEQPRELSADLRQVADNVIATGDIDSLTALEAQLFELDTPATKPLVGKIKKRKAELANPDYKKEIYHSGSSKIQGGTFPNAQIGMPLPKVPVQLPPQKK